MTDDTMQRVGDALRHAAETDKMPASFILGVRQRAFLRLAIQQHSGNPNIEVAGARIGNLPVWFSDEPDKVELEVLADLGEFMAAERCLKISRKAP
jgi:hypothetical protein